MYDKYLMLFHFLDYCYDKSSDLDLGAFLGELSPYTFHDRMPMNCSVYEEWYSQSIDLNSDELLIQGIILLLTQYETIYHYDFKETKKILKELTQKEVTQIMEKIKKNN